MDERIHAAGVLVEEADRVLAFRRADSGRLGLPFGLVDPGETPQEAARRECLEETGFAVALLPEPPFVARTPGGRLAATFRARRTGAQAPPSHPEEGSAVWVSRAEFLADTGFSGYLEAMFAFFEGAPG